MGYRRVCFAVLLAACMVTFGRAWGQTKPGVVVEEVAKNSEGEKAGLREGDVLLSWSRGEAKGEITSPFDSSWIEIEQAPRGSVILEGLRGTEKRTWEIGRDRWGINARPNMSQSLLSIYLEGQELAKAGRMNEAVERWRAAGAEARTSSAVWLSAWLLFHSAAQLIDHQKWNEADILYKETAEESTQAGPTIAAQVLQTWATTFQLRSDWAQAERYNQRAILECRKLGPDGLMVAVSLSRLGTMADDRGEYGEAAEYHDKALKIREALAPASLAVASSFHDLSVLALDHGELAEAESYIRQGLALREKLAPESLPFAQSLNQLGFWYAFRGDLINAPEYFHRAFVIRQKLAPESLDLAVSLNNLGWMADSRSDYAEAEQYYRGALVIRERLSPGSLGVAKCLNNLASLAQERGDIAVAAEYYRRALAIFAKVIPNNANVPQILDNLGGIANERGDLDKAEAYYQRGLDAARRISPDNVYVAVSLFCLGGVADGNHQRVKAERYLQQALALFNKISPDGHIYSGAVLNSLGGLREEIGDVDGAEKYYRKALALYERLAPGSVGVASTLSYLASVARTRGDLAQAEDYYRQSLAIMERSAPGRIEHATVLTGLAGVKRRQHKFDDAEQLYRQALDVLENQTTRLGGSEQIRSGFRAKYADYYKDYIDLLIARNNFELAFQTLERLRARSLLEMLTQAQVDIHKGVDASFVRQERALLESFSAKSQRRVQLLGDQHAEKQLADLDKQIKEVLDQYQDVEDQIRASSPAYAAITQPQPLNAQQVQQQLLDADTTLLEYSLGQHRSYLFVVTANSLRVYPLPKAAIIEQQARKVYASLTVRNSRKKGETFLQWQAQVAKVEKEYPRPAAELSKLVLGHLAAAELQGKRLLIVSDGALQYIPFAALPAPKASAAGKAGTPLMVEHEIINLPSASVLSVLRRENAQRNKLPKLVAVLADPVFDEKDVRVQGKAAKDRSTNHGLTRGENAEEDLLTNLMTRSAADIGLSAKAGEIRFPRLQLTRREAKDILAVTPAGQGMEALDFKASWATATNPALAQYQIVHFATHGFLDSKHPELSGLVLSLVNEHGQRQNGFLGLQDIYNLNLPAELVVLSACETGLGKEIQGEGLVGLTRGFMYAGATRVVASLWKIDDEGTAKLMRHFYTALEQERRAPAAALRQAQIQMWKQERWRSPYYWAAFQIQGEWK